MAESDGGLAPNACLRCYEIDDFQDAFFRLSYFAQMGPYVLQDDLKIAHDDAKTDPRLLLAIVVFCPNGPLDGPR